jgi:hypothetical protein
MDLDFDSCYRAIGEHQDLAWLLCNAGERLKCPVDCDTVCERCLLSATTQYIAPELDRAAALALVISKVLPGLLLGPERRCSVP